MAQTHTYSTCSPSSPLMRKSPGEVGFYSTGWSLFSVTEARLVTSFTCWPLHTSPLLLLATQIWAMSTSACLSENPQRVFNLLQGTGDKSWGRAQCSQSTARSCGDGDTSQCCHPHASPPDFRDEGQTQLQEVGHQGQGTPSTLSRLNRPVGPPSISAKTHEGPLVQGHVRSEAHTSAAIAQGTDGGKQLCRGTLKTSTSPTCHPQPPKHSCPGEKETDSSHRASRTWVRQQPSCQ